MAIILLYGCSLPLSPIAHLSTFRALSATSHSNPLLHRMIPNPPLSPVQSCIQLEFNRYLKLFSDYSTTRATYLLLSSPLLSLYPCIAYGIVWTVDTLFSFFMCRSITMGGILSIAQLEGSQGEISTINFSLHGKQLTSLSTSDGSTSRRRWGIKI